MSVAGFSIIALGWMALLCACTLVNELLESAAEARLPVPSASSWPWGAEVSHHCYRVSTACGLTMQST